MNHNYVCIWRGYNSYGFCCIKCGCRTKITNLLVRGEFKLNPPIVTYGRSVYLKDTRKCKVSDKSHKNKENRHCFNDRNTCAKCDTHYGISTNMARGYMESNAYGNGIINLVLSRCKVSDSEYKMKQLLS